MQPSPLALDLTRPPRPQAAPAGVATRSIAAGARQASKIYRTGESEVRALDEVDVDFEAGRFTAIMGPSGSGKSTLMQCVAGLDSLSSGSVFIGSTDLTRLGEKERTLVRRHHVGFVFQAFNLVPTLTALENITLPLGLAGRRADQTWLDTVIDTVGLRSRLGHRPEELSGGQRQRVAIARALVSQPSVIFADEPTGNLDSRSGGEILDFLRMAVDSMGQTIVMVTHDPNAAAFADRVIFLADGSIVEDAESPTAVTVLDHMLGIGA